LRRINWFVLILALGAFALRVFRIDFQSLWYDEAFSVYLAQFSLAEITARTAADIQPPLYYYLLHFWITIAGDSEFAVRFPSLFFGVITIPLMFVTARKLFFNSTAAFIAAILATISPLYVWYSQETRMYTMITFLLLLSSYALLQGMESEETKGKKGIWWSVFILANIAAIYTHYFAFAIIAFQLVFTAYCLLFTDLRSRITYYALRFTIYFALIFFSFLPWLPFVLARFGQDVSYWRGDLKLDEALQHILINFTMGESVLESQAQWIAVGWMVCLVGSWIVGWLGNRKTNQQTNKLTNYPTLFLILYLAIPLLLLLFLFSRNPKFNARYLMVASPAFFMLVASGLASLANRAHKLRFTLYVLAFAFLFFTSAYSIANAYFDPAFTKASFRDVAHYIDKTIAPDEAIILTSGHLFPAFNYYYHGNAPQVRLPDDPTLNADHILGYDIARVLNQTVAGKRGVWVVEWQNEVVDPNGFLPMMLSSRGMEQEIPGTNFYQVRLRHWALNSRARFSADPQPSTKVAANFQNAIQIIGFDAPTPTPADTGASFNLYWQVTDTLEEDYVVALRVLDAQGNMWGKQDRRPAGYNYPTTRWKKGEYLFGAYSIPLLAGTPAGNYFVQAIFYTKDNPNGLDVLAPNGAPIGKTIKLGPIAVLPAEKPATLAALNIQNTISQSLGSFTFLGYQLGRDKASAGESIPLTLFWRADTKPIQDYKFKIQFGDTASDALPLANLQSPTSKWRQGEVVRGQYQIAIPANAKDGATQLRVVLSDGNALDLAPFTIEKTDRVFVKPNAQFMQNTNLSNLMLLVGYDMSAMSTKPGDSLKLVLYWQAQSKIDKPYTVFVHLLDKDNKVVAQKDAQPANGVRPTTTWVANEFVADAYDLAIKPDVAPGTYRIEIGVYDSQDPSFKRLQVLGDGGVPIDDHIILKTTISVQ
jgi:4-amino-4-deoxy-L-arabinose transferase-like glycosyltransferase